MSILDVLVFDEDIVFSGTVATTFNLIRRKGLKNKINFDCRNNPSKSNATTERYSRSQWPRGLRRRSTAARPLRSWVRIPPGAWIFVCCECCVLSGRGLCGELITRPEESYRLWRVVECDHETSNEEAKTLRGCGKYNQKGCNAKKTNKQTNRKKYKY